VVVQVAHTPPACSRSIRPILERPFAAGWTSIRASLLQGLEALFGARGILSVSCLLMAVVARGTLVDQCLRPSGLAGRPLRLSAGSTCFGRGFRAVGLRAYRCAGATLTCSGFVLRASCETRVVLRGFALLRADARIRHSEGRLWDSRCFMIFGLRYEGILRDSRRRFGQCSSTSL
jgi:hypothetical protein